MSHTAEFELHGLKVEVEFDFEPEEERTFSNPCYSEIFEIHKLVIGGKDCTNALWFGNVESEIIEAIGKENAKNFDV